MKPTKVFQFVNDAELPKVVSLKKLDDAVRASTFKLPGYMIHTFPFYREVDSWPGAVGEGDKNELVYRFGEGSRGEIRFDTKCNFAIRTELQDQEGIYLKLLLEEILGFYTYFNRIIRLAGVKGMFRLSVALEGMQSLQVNYSELPESPGLAQMSAWALPDDEIIQVSATSTFSFPGLDVLVSASTELESIVELLVDLAFNVSAIRYDPKKGRFPDRLRLDKATAVAVAAKLSQGIYTALPDEPKKKR